jgi:hypothetical protein
MRDGWLVVVEVIDVVEVGEDGEPRLAVNIGEGVRHSGLDLDPEAKMQTALELNLTFKKGKTGKGQRR